MQKYEVEGSQDDSWKCNMVWTLELMAVLFTKTENERGIETNKIQ